LIVTGEAGGTWVARKQGDDWLLGSDRDGAAGATLRLDQNAAWRLFTKGITRDEARRRAHLEGDVALAEAALGTVSILG
jgi:hypothetical protein